MMFEVGRTTANEIFHYWLSILRDLLPSSLLEQWEKSLQDHQFLQELLTSHPLLVDSAEQPRQRPIDNQEQEKYFSGKQQYHSFKNQLIVLSV